MLEKFINGVKTLLGYVQQDWIALGALIVAAFILAVGFVMTINMSGKLADNQSPYHVIRNRSRRNIIFFFAFAFAIASTVLIFDKFPGKEVLYLTVPALVMLWAFFCEALFERIDDNNRRRAGIKVNYFDGSNANANVQAPVAKTEEVKTVITQKKEEIQIQQQKSQKEVERENIEADRKREEIREQLKRAEQLERERAEVEQWREEIREMHVQSQADEEELRRQRFENERKQLELMARQTQPVKFAPEPRQYEKPAPRQVPVDFSSERESRYYEKPSSTVQVTTTTTTTSTAAYDRLQAKLDALRKETQNSAIPAQGEVRGKYEEPESRSSLADLIRSMNARRKTEDTF